MFPIKNICLLFVYHNFVFGFLTSVIFGGEVTCWSAKRALASPPDPGLKPDPWELQRLTLEGNWAQPVEGTQDYTLSLEVVETYLLDPKASKGSLPWYGSLKLFARLYYEAPQTEEGDELSAQFKPLSSLLGIIDIDAYMPSSWKGMYLAQDMFMGTVIGFPNPDTPEYTNTYYQMYTGFFYDKGAALDLALKACKEYKNSQCYVSRHPPFIDKPDYFIPGVLVKTGDFREFIYFQKLLQHREDLTRLPFPNETLEEDSKYAVRNFNPDEEGSSSLAMFRVPIPNNHQMVPILVPDVFYYLAPFEFSVR